MELLYLENIRRYEPWYAQGHTVWHGLHPSRRSAVYILLFLGSLGELRVILTKRSSKLRSFPGHISFPGGKADSEHESEWQVSRREMGEEIGLSLDNNELQRNYGFTIDNLNVMPCYLSRTFSAVRPCIGFMNVSNVLELELITNLKLSVNPGESSSIFSCPLRDFLYPCEADNAKEALERTSHDIHWGGIPWKLRSYLFLQNNEFEAPWLREFKDISASEEEVDSEGLTEDEADKKRQLPVPVSSKKKKMALWGRLGARRHSETNERIYDVWGLTANILHDLAVITYDKKSDQDIGQEDLIHALHNAGQMKNKARSVAESKLIKAGVNDKFGFGDVLPRTEFLRLKRVYKPYL